MISQGLKEPSAFTFIFVFFGGLLTSLGPCSLSLLPITIAYLAGFNNDQSPLIRSLTFCSGIVFSLVILGSISGFLGKIYGQLPIGLTTLVAILAVLMGLNLLGAIKINLPTGPDPKKWEGKIPKPLGPVAAGIAFGLASSPCSTPVLAVLLAWITQSESPFLGMLLLLCFGAGQVIPLFIAGIAAGTIPKLLAFRPFGSWITALSGVFFITTGLLTLISRWI